MLHYSVIPSTDPQATHTGVFLHGILGSGRNWRSFAARMARALPSWRWIAVDLRCHGESPPQTPPHTLNACAADVKELLEALGADAVIGHSFGGKVGLAMAEAHMIPDSSPLFVLDSALGPRSPGSATAALVDTVIEALCSGPQQTPTRGDMRRALDERGLPPHLVAWLLTSLSREEGGWRWRYDLSGVGALMRSYHEGDYWGLLEAQVRRAQPQIHIIRAGKGGHWSSQDVARLDQLHEGQAIHHACLPDAGHWLHVDEPEALASLLSARLELFTA